MDVSQDSAIKACVSPSTPLVTKISRATKACLGGDDTFDWEDFSRLNEESLNSYDFHENCLFFKNKLITLFILYKNTVYNNIKPHILVKS